MSEIPYLGQNTDIILGQEFLTWLWFASDTRNGLFRKRDKAEFSLFMEQRISVQGGEGESMETATVSGALSRLREARLGLATGKKVTRALVRMEQGADVWHCVLKAGDFSLSSLRTPKIDRKDGADQGDIEPDAALLEKVFLMEEATAFLDELYGQFLSLRISPAAWKEESARIRDWIHQDI